MVKLILVFAACLAAGFFGGAFAAHFPGDSSAWASWFQAVGSIAAIIGAFVVGDRQSTAAIESVREGHRIAEASRRTAMFAVMRAAHMRARLIRSAMDAEVPVIKLMSVYHSTVLDSLVAAMNSMNAAEIGSDEAVQAFLIFSGQFVFLRDSLEKYLQGPSRDETTRKSIDQLNRHGYGQDHVQTLLDATTSRLKHNVVIHLNQIDEEFSTLSGHFS
ncbi:hypothetical protein [Paraburkholderia tropica]|uniref:hypothetical protein n=1 Tax=Paraburkholderia tropica TaxID=92647 RepID=UPI002AB250A5|nr:hypothetical protein [Paraburkholderia tropica]